MPRFYGKGVVRNDDLNNRYYYEEQQSQTTSFSMRYAADPWLYESTVLAPKSTIFLAPFQYENGATAAAAAAATAPGYYPQPTLVLCTCKDYMTGTRKSSKKQQQQAQQQTSVTVCKKCKGARLPPLGGTTCAKRFLKNGFFANKDRSLSQASAATVRHLNRFGSSSGSSARVRSHCTGTVRSLADYCIRPSLWTLFDTGFMAEPVQQNFPDDTTSQQSMANRKSILECNINPYELVSDHIAEINGQRIALKSLKTEIDCGEWATEPDVDTDVADEPDDTRSTVQQKKCFKSILKRPASDCKVARTAETDAAVVEVAKTTTTTTVKQKLTARTLSRIPVGKTTANFYLPLPEIVADDSSEPVVRNVPKNRKKVQFLDNDDDESADLSPPPPHPPQPSSPPPLPPLQQQPPKPKIVERPKIAPPPPPPPPPRQLPPSSEIPKPPPRRKYQNQQTQTINTNDISTTSTSAPDRKPSTTTIVYLKTPDNPSPVPKPEPLVHKLEIKHAEDEPINLNTITFVGHEPKTVTSSLKTSILINGDNCYSTVNVSNNRPLYQSSVIVKGTTIHTDSGGGGQGDDGNECLPSRLDSVDDDDTVSLADTLVPQDYSNDELVVTGDSDRTKSDDDDGDDVDNDDDDEHSFYEAIDRNSDSYSNRSSLTEEEDVTSNRSKFYELLAAGTELSTSSDQDPDSYTNHAYEIIKTPCTSNQLVDPIYEDIEVTSPAPSDDDETTKSIFEGASKYDILNYLASAKERGVLVNADEAYSTISLSELGDVDDEADDRNSSSWSPSDETGSGSESGVLVVAKSTEIERNDSGIGSESSKTSRSRYQLSAAKVVVCEDCDANVSTDDTVTGGGRCCWRCAKKRNERKDIIREIVETEEKYGRDLQIVLEEFYQPMMVAGLLTGEQLAAIFLNVDELLENSVALASRMRASIADAIATNDHDWLTVNMGRIFLDAAVNLHAFERYCVRHANASLLLASLEKDKELLRIFLQVSQMENTLLRRMNLNSFLMVPVQRVTKYPLLLSRLQKVTCASRDQEHRTLLRDAQLQVELHLSHINSETKDVPGKLWRRSRTLGSELDLTKIKLRKLAIDVLEWNHEHAQFVLETKLFYTQPSDHQWRKGRLIKLTSINALLVTNQKTTPNAEQQSKDAKNTPSTIATTTTNQTRESALILIRDKNGRYSLLRDPLYLNRCIIATDPAWQHYFEVQEIIGSKDTYIFKGDNSNLTQLWYRTLQMHAQGTGAWRKRRNALPNIMIYGMNSRTPN